MHAQRLKTWFRSTMTQERFTNLTIFNSHKERTNKHTRSLVDLANEFSDRNDNRRTEKFWYYQSLPQFFEGLYRFVNFHSDCAPFKHL